MNQNEMTPERKLVRGLVFYNSTHTLVFAFSCILFIPSSICGFVFPLPFVLFVCGAESILMSLVTTYKCCKTVEDSTSIPIGRYLRYYPIKISLVRKEIYRVCLRTIAMVEAAALLPMLILFLKFDLIVFLSSALMIMASMASIMVLMVEINLRAGK